MHVLDASRAVGVVSRLKSPELRGAFAEENRLDQEKARLTHGAPGRPQLLTLEEARRRKPPFDWASQEIPEPSFTGDRVFDPVPLEEIVPYIDWTPLFHAWELKGIYPQILDRPEVGPRARELFDDAQELLAEIVREKWLTARAVIGFFPANSVGDDIEVYGDGSRSRLLGVFHTLRQQGVRPEGEHNFALADFIAPEASGRRDYLGLFAVTAGIGAEELAAKFASQQDDYNAIMSKALADRLAEALAERMHLRARQYWGFGEDEQLSCQELIREKYRGIRPAPGYPACPDHTEKHLLFSLLQAERLGMQLTENLAMHPAASVSGFYFSHPASRYFAVGKIGRDQAIDYHRRKGMELKEVERWLGPSLNYDPA